MASLGKLAVNQDHGSFLYRNYIMLSTLAQLWYKPGWKLELFVRLHSGLLNSLVWWTPGWHSGGEHPLGWKQTIDGTLRWCKWLQFKGFMPIYHQLSMTPTAKWNSLCHCIQIFLHIWFSPTCSNPVLLCYEKTNECEGLSMHAWTQIPIRSMLCFEDHAICSNDIENVSASCPLH